MRSWERSGRVTLMWISFFLLCAFFMIPVTAVQAILSTNSLVSFIDKIPIVNSIITAIIPGKNFTCKQTKACWNRRRSNFKRCGSCC